MKNDERILIEELRDNKEIDPKKHSMLLLRDFESKGYIELLFDSDNEVENISKGKWFAAALEEYLKDKIELDNKIRSVLSDQIKPNIAEKNKLEVCYTGSGVKSLRVLSTILVLFAIIGLILILIGFVSIDNLEVETGNFLLILGVIFLLQSCVFAPILRGLATIAETALIKKHIIQTEYDVIENTDSATSNN